MPSTGDYTLTVRQGNTLDETFYVYEDAAATVPHDLVAAGYTTGAGQIRDDYASRGGALLGGLTVTVPGSPTNAFRVQASAVVTAAISPPVADHEHVYDVELAKVDGTKWTPIAGKVALMLEVTV